MLSFGGKSKNLLRRLDCRKIIFKENKRIGGSTEIFFFSEYSASLRSINLSVHRALAVSVEIKGSVDCAVPKPQLESF